jgi:hypothetical protein
MRGLLMGALMLGFGAVFTFGLAVAMQQRATANTPNYAPGEPATAAAKRTAQEWMF